jgi:plastocyanin
MRELTRREILGAAAVGAAVGTAGCLGGGSPGSGAGGDSDGDGGGVEAALDAPDGTEVVEVGPDGEYVYEPDDLAVSPGTTVRFVWLSGGHDLKVESQPTDADWQGVQTLEARGATHEFTFEVAGVYEYVCTPHASYGMRGRVSVDPEA